MTTKQRSRKAAVNFFCEGVHDAKNIYLAGDFNAWNPEAMHMVKKDGAFHKKVQLPPGEYQYKFLVDGRWQTDLASSLGVSDGLGGLNSVGRVTA